jgi:hypothetical protein
MIRVGLIMAGERNRPNPLKAIVNRLSLRDYTSASLNPGEGIPCGSNWGKVL